MSLCTPNFTMSARPTTGVRHGKQSGTCSSGTKRETFPSLGTSSCTRPDASRRAASVTLIVSGMAKLAQPEYVASDFAFEREPYDDAEEYRVTKAAQCVLSQAALCDPLVQNAAEGSTKLRFVTPSYKVQQRAQPSCTL